MTEPTEGVVSLGARVHFFVHPDLRGDFTALLAGVLNCTVLERDFGLEHPILFVPFPDGSGFSVEFSILAPLRISGGLAELSCATEQVVTLRDGCGRSSGRTVRLNGFLPVAGRLQQVRAHRHQPVRIGRQAAAG
jgi:hypothetical protein